MRPQPNAFKAMTLLVVLAMLMTMLPTASAQQAVFNESSEIIPQVQNATNVTNKIDPLVLSEIADDGSTDFFIWLARQADVSAARQLNSKQDKGQFVFNTLQRTAEQSQKEIRTYLDSQRADYRPYYIANVILVRNGSERLLKNLAARSDVERILPNRSFQLEEPFIVDPAPRETLTIEPNLTFINADDVWALGITGEGMVMAGGDTGIQWDHPALINQYRGWNGTSVDHNYNWWDATGKYPYVPGDGHGHGTHISGTMVGDDGGGNRIGVAPGAQVIHCKNMTDGGGGWDAYFIECFEWVLAPWDLNGENPMPSMAPNAMNNSWGYWGGGVPQFMDIIDNLQTAGILVEVSAGNSGPACATLGSPGDYAQVLTTGSVNHQSGVLPGTLTGFSSRGPSSIHPDSFFPDIMAPGEQIRSSLPGNTYASWSGTSMSGPHATALVGLMWSANPALTGLVDETIDLIKNTAVPLSGVTGSNCGGDYSTGPNHDWGYGTIDALAAVDAAIGMGTAGTIQGTVTESGIPVEGVIIKAVGDYSRSTKTNAQGEYKLILPAGFYEISATKYGYETRTIPNVEIIEDGSHFLNIILDLAGIYTVSGVISDSITGWPLYAQIKIVGYPGEPIWTDPLTGVYAIQLAGGFEFIFNVDAWVDGYLTENRTVGPLSEDSIEDFELSVDSLSCSAPGYSPEIYFFEDFESGFDNWTMGGLWNPEAEQDTCGSKIAPFPSPQKAVYYGDDNTCNFDVGENTGTLSMISPVSLPITGSMLSFYSYEETECGGLCEYDYRLIEISVDDGSEWNILGTGITEGKWHKRTFDLTPYSGEDALIRFRFDSGDEAFNDYFGWMLDNIAITDFTCTPQPGGLVVGNVYDENTGNPIVAASVSSDMGFYTSTKATPADTDIDDGFFTLFVPVGFNQITASKALYGLDSQSVVIPGGTTIWQDFYLPAGLLSADPDSLIVNIDMGSSQVETLDLINLGGMDINFSTIKVHGGLLPSSEPTLVNVPAPAGDFPEGSTGAQSKITRQLHRDDWSYLDANPLLRSETDILILSSDDLSGEPLRSILLSYPDIRTVDVWSAWSSTPPLSVLEAYDVVITWSYYPYADRIAMGDVLADYVDGGGYVIQSVFNWYDNNHWGLGGRFVDEGYSPFLNINGGNQWTYATLGDHDPAHPLMEGVTQVSDSWRDVVDLNPDAVLVARWSDGEEFVAFKRNVVAINTYTGIDYNWTGDMGIIFHNAVNFLIASGVPWLSVEPNEGTVSDTLVINVSFDAGVNEVFLPGEYYATVRFRNDTPYGSMNVPVTMNVALTDAYGKLEGHIKSKGYCDLDPHTLPQATVRVTSSLGNVWEVKSDADGYYQMWLNEDHSPLSITVTHPTHEGDNADNVVVVGQQTTAVDFDLRWLVPCMSVDPPSMEVTLDYDDSISLPLELINEGGGMSEFRITEQNLGFQQLASIPTGQGEWLYQSISGEWLNNNTGQFSLAYPSAYRWTSNLLSDINILIYADDIYHPPSDTYLDQALRHLGLSYTAHYNGDFNGFVSNLNSRDWDVVLFANDNYSAGPTQFDALNNYVNNGGLLVFHGWTVFFEPDHPLWSNLGIAWIANDNDPPNPVYWWDQTHTIFTKPQVVPEFTDLQGGRYGIYGQQVEPLPTFKAIAGYTTPGPDYGQAALVVGNENRTVFKGFLDGQNDADQNGNGLNDGVELWINLISGFSFDVPWLSTLPEEGMIDPDSTSEVSVTFDSNLVNEPGEYLAALKIKSNDPVRRVISVPVSMTVNSLPTLGILEGTVTSLGYCDTDPSPLKDAVVHVQSNVGDTWTLTTNKQSQFSRWFEQSGSPYTVTITADDHITTMIEDVMITQQNTTTIDIDVRWDKACLSAEPEGFSVTVPRGFDLTLPLDLTNDGAGSAEFSFFELAGSSAGLGAQIAAVSSNINPEGYVPSLTLSSHVGSNPLSYNVAVFKDNDPWGSTATEQILADYGIPYEVHTSASFTTLDFNQFGMIIISGDQPQVFYDAYADHVDKFTAYVNNGGFLNFFACDSGWNGGSLWADLPGGMTWNGGFPDFWNDIEDTNHPVVQGVPNPFWGGFASHGYFSNLPDNAQTIARQNDLGMPTIVEYPIGSGWLVAFSQPLEVSFDYGWDAGLILVNTVLWGNEFEPWVDIPWLTQIPETGVIDGDDSLTVDITFTAETEMELGQHKATMVLLSNDPAHRRIEIPVTMTVVAEAGYAVKLTADENARSGKPGESVPYSLTLTNTGTNADSYSIGANGNVWEVSTPVNSIELAAGASTNVSVSVTIPTSADPDDIDIVTITATSAANTEVSASQILTTTATVNLAPVADAGEDQSVNRLALVTLDGSESDDPDGDLPLTYQWTQKSGTGVSLINPTTVSPTFYAPDVPGILIFELVVTDSLGAISAADEVEIMVVNLVPVADAGENQSVNRLVQVTLDGSESDDSDGDLPLTYQWTQKGGTAVSLINPTTVSPTFYAPFVPGTLIFELVVTDFLGAISAADEVEIMVVNLAPVADAGEDQSVNRLALVTLDGSESDDPDGDLPLTYQWTQKSGTGVSLINPTTVSPTFYAPDVPGILIFELVVTDSHGLASEPDTVEITVVEDQAPTIFQIFLPLILR